MPCTEEFLSNRATTSSKWAGWGVLIGFLALWLGAAWPGLGEAWWWADDFLIMEWKPAELPWLNIPSGRPLSAELFRLILLMKAPDGVLGNIWIRLGQGTLHVLSAWLVFGIFRRRISLGAAAGCALPFLLWPFNGEVVLWFGGLQHAAALFCGVLGVWMLGVSRWKWFWSAVAMMMCAMSPLHNQAHIGVPVVIWLATVWERYAGGKNPGEGPAGSAKVRGLDLFRESTAVLGGLLIGSIISIGYLHRYENTRGTYADSLGEQVKVAQELIYRWVIWPEFYPWTIPALHVLFLSTAIIVLIAAAIRRRSRWESALLGWGLIGVGPLLILMPNLILKYQWPSFRMYYGMSIYLGVILYMIFRMTGKRGRGYILGLVVVLIGCYAMIHREVAGEYLRNYREDVRVIGRAVTMAKEAQGTEILFVAPPHCGNTWNPNAHLLRYNHCGSMHSNFFIPWAWPALLRLHAPQLTIVTDEREMAQYTEFCQTLPPGPPHWQVVADPAHPRRILIIPR